MSDENDEPMSGVDRAMLCLMGFGLTGVGYRAVTDPPMGWAWIVPLGLLVGICGLANLAVALFSGWE